MTNDTADPFILPPQSVVSFSGGRTSAYMLWRILQANGGGLPPDAVVIFNNTGKEREETLEFVRDCGERWGVEIKWLEYRFLASSELRTAGKRTLAKGRHLCAAVDFETASRNGEPFRDAIRARTYLPNQLARFCTVEMKIRTTNRFVRQRLGWEKYRNAIGLRADEPKRVAKMMAKRTVTIEPTLFGEEKRVDRGASHPPGESPFCPLAQAGVTNADILEFWASQPFDLKLPADPRTGKTTAGNCDLCFLKGAGTIVDLIRQRPESADWWIESETLIPTNEAGTARFRPPDRLDYSEMKRIALGMVDEPGWLWADRGGMACGEAIDCNCTD